MSIEIKRLTKRFGDYVALDDIDLSVGDRELVALLGPSGSGTTTLPRIIAGLELAHAGDVRPQGQHRAGSRQPRRRPAPRQERDDPQRARAPDRLRVPALRAVPPHERVRERGL